MNAMYDMFQLKGEKMISKNGFSSDPFLGCRLIINTDNHTRKFRFLETINKKIVYHNHVNLSIKNVCFNNVILTIRTDIKTFMDSYKKNSIKLECNKCIDYSFYLFLYSRNRINPIQYDQEFVYLTIPLNFTLLNLSIVLEILINNLIQNSLQTLY